MRYWKVILATLVIFVAGGITGGLVVTQIHRTESATVTSNPTNFSVAPRSVVWPARPSPVPSTNLTHWNILKANYLERVARELDLTPDQSQRIETIISESQKRTKELSDAMAPKVREEVRRARERMRAELTPEQRIKYDRLTSKPHQGRKPPAKVVAYPAPASNSTSAPVVK